MITFGLVSVLFTIIAVVVRYGWKKDPSITRAIALSFAILEVYLMLLNPYQNSMMHVSIEPDIHLYGAEIYPILLVVCFIINAFTLKKIKLSEK